MKIKHLRIQCILFNNNKADIKFALQSLANAIKLVKQSGAIDYVEIVYGDCSPLQIFKEEEIKLLTKECNGTNIDKLDYCFFNSNLGSAAGHNTLLSHSSTEYLLILNPDVVMAPNTLKELINSFNKDKIGIVEARQIPIEHPKDYNSVTGETSWASTACAMTKTELAQSIGGFDHKTFFLYCDDVDFSWRMKLAGYRVIYQPAAIIFHDKKLTNDAKHISSAVEEYYSAEAALMLAHKYSRPDMLKNILVDFELHGKDSHKKALNEYKRRLESNELPDPIDKDHRVAEFVNGNYAKHRF